MDKQDTQVFIQRSIAVGMLFLVVLCLLGGALRSFTSSTRPNEQGHQVPNEHKGDLANSGGIIVGALVVAVITVSIIRNFGGYHGHRRKSHAAARILWDGDCASEIEITNLDDMDVSELSHDVNWSSLAARINMRGGRWVWKFNYMGDRRYYGRTANEQYAMEMSDPVHQMNMRDTLNYINSYLEQVINPMKDRA